MVRKRSLEISDRDIGEMDRDVFNQVWTGRTGMDRNGEWTGMGLLVKQLLGF